VRVIAAGDDPIIPSSDLARLARVRNLAVTQTRYGGHCGFHDGQSGPTWVERETLAAFAV
jgi:predicted alpha/beta-fold hydrolase